MMKRPIFLIVLILLGMLAPLSNADTVIIVNKDNPVASMSRTDLLLIYQGRKKVYGSGEIIVPVDTAEHHSRQEFFSRILRKDEESYRLYWVRMIFAGKGQPPLAVKTGDDAVRFVAANKGAIAFVDSARVTGDVKTIRVLEDE